MDDLLRKFAITLGLSLTLNVWANPQEYLLLSQDPDFLQRNKEFTQTVSHQGRSFVVTLIKPWEKIPQELQKNLLPIKPNEIVNQFASLPFAPQDADPRILELSKQVSSTNLKESIRLFSDLEKRATRDLDQKKDSGNKKTMDMISGAFKAQGLEVSTQCYTKRRFDDECNIIGVKKSNNPAAKNIAVVAHLDSVNFDKAGADDNASGVAGLIELARITKDLKLDNNIVFVAVNGEEVGLNGSTAYVSNLKKNGQLSNLSYVVAMDMIAYNKDGILNLETNNEFLDYTEWVGVQSRLYTKLKAKITTPAWGSDHVPFLNEKIPTFLLIENWEAHNPCYHKACDTMANINIDYATELIKLNLAVIVQKAGLSL